VTLVQSSRRSVSRLYEFNIIALTGCARASSLFLSSIEPAATGTPSNQVQEPLNMASGEPQEQSYATSSMVPNGAPIGSELTASSSRRPQPIPPHVPSDTPLLASLYPPKEGHRVSSSSDLTASMAGQHSTHTNLQSVHSGYPPLSSSQSPQVVSIQPSPHLPPSTAIHHETQNTGSTSKRKRGGWSFIIRCDCSRD
jgi:hypothetical protein